MAFSDSAAPAVTLPTTLRLGAVHLTVTDLDRAVAFYQDAIGLQVHRREDGVATIGAGGGDLLVLTEDPAARPAGRHAGLFHFALLYPAREDLARALQRLAAARTPLTGASDHGVSEALYLSDPDGNGIELYADRPRAEWPAPNGPGERVGIFSLPLDVGALLDTVAGDAPRRHAEPGLVMGHVHLHVADIDDALAFYRDVIGFDVMAVHPGVGFVAAAGYHHHLGINTWRGTGIPPAPADAVGLRHWTVVLPDGSAVDAVGARAAAAGLTALQTDDGLMLRDPAGNAAVFTPSA